ncbi:MAG: phosphoribosyltransferase [Thermoplasmata archaeon]|nr:phosphoribosyltransferase [Thermoplasmata archaeon]
MADFPQCRLATWADADRWSARIADQVRAADHLPDVIVGLTRGGWVPSRLLADHLGVKRLLALRVQHWGITATVSRAAEITEALHGSVDDARVLLLDDITDTGESLELATKHVAERRPARVESAAFLHIGHAKFVPTYYAEEIPRGSWVWVVFPWNYWEDVRHFVRLSREESDDVEVIRRIIGERCGLDLPREHVAKALSAGEPPKSSAAG